MSGPLGACLAAAAVGGVVAVDRTAVGNTLVGRPLVAATVLGAILGCPAQGAFVGFVYELLFLRSLPVGAHIPLHPLYPSVLAVAALGSGVLGPPGWSGVPVAVVLALPTVLADRFVEDVWRSSNEALFSRAAALLRTGRDLAPSRIHLLAVLRCLVLNFSVILLCGVLLVLAVRLAAASLPSAGRLFSLAVLAPFVLGASGMAAQRARGDRWVGFAAGLLLGALAAGWSMP